MYNIKNKDLLAIIFKGLLISLNLLFLIYYITLSFNYCLHYDDVHFMWKMREYSIFEYVKEMYLTRGGNFVGYLINGILFSVSNKFLDYHILPIIFYFIGILITFIIAKSFIKEYKWLDVLLGVTTFYNLYILTSPDFAVFTWICAMSYYLFAPSICLILLYINKQCLMWWQWIVLVLLCIFISGNSVSISTITFVILFVNGMILWKKHLWDVKSTWNDIRVKKIIGLTIIMLTIFAVVVVAPGNYLRMETEFDIEQPKNFFEFIIACLKCFTMFLYLQSFYMPYYCIIFVLGYFVGINKKINITTQTKYVLLTISCYIIYLLISVMPLAYLSNGFQIQRNYTQLTYFLMLTFLLIGIIIGSKSNKTKTAHVIGLLSTLFLLCIIILNVKQDIPVAIAYSKAHELRESKLIELRENGNTETIIVQPFPSTHTSDAKYNTLKLFRKKTSMPTVYYESDTDYKPNEYEYYIKKLYNLNFDFLLDDKKEL